MFFTRINDLFINSVFQDLHGYSIDYIFQQIITSLVISSRYSTNDYFFCSYKTIADQNSLIWKRHFKQINLNSLVQKYEYLITYMVYICAFLSGLGTSKTWNMTSSHEIVPLRHYFISRDYGKTI